MNEPLRCAYCGERLPPDHFIIAGVPAAGRLHRHCVDSYKAREANVLRRRWYATVSAPLTPELKERIEASWSESTDDHISLLAKHPKLFG